METNGTGKGLSVKLTNSSNSSAAVNISTSGSGAAISAVAGSGLAGDFAGTVKVSNFRMTAGAGSGKVMVSDAYGNASWINPSSIYSVGGFTTLLAAPDAGTDSTSTSVMQQTIQYQQNKIISLEERVAALERLVQELAAEK